MDEFLAELYGTPQNVGGAEDLEKTAAEEMLVKLAAEEGVDLAELSDEEIGGLLTEIESTKTASAETETATEPNADEEAQEKLAEADFLGRAMAHAYVAELSEIDKQASTKAEGGEKTATVKEKVLGILAKRKKSLASAGRLAKEGITGKYGPSGAKMTRGSRLARLRMAAGKAKPELAGAAGLAAAGGAAAALKKKSSDEGFEAAANERAFEMLSEAGYDVEKIAEANMQAQVQERAVELLTEAGYKFE